MPWPGPCRPHPFCPQGELVTASKAIIEKEYQPHVIVSTTGPNPFNTLTDRELEEYRREVERKQKGSAGEWEAAPESPARGVRAVGSVRPARYSARGSKASRGQHTWEWCW